MSLQNVQRLSCLDKVFAVRKESQSPDSAYGTVNKGNEKNHVDVQHRAVSRSAVSQVLPVRSFLFLLVTHSCSFYNNFKISSKSALDNPPLQCYNSQAFRNECLRISLDTRSGGSTREKIWNIICRYGGIGRRVWFRSIWGQLLAGSTPVTCTKEKSYVQRA